MALEETMNTIIVEYKGAKTGLLRIFLIMLSVANAGCLVILYAIGELTSVREALTKAALCYLIGLLMMACGWFANKMMYT